MKTSSTRSGAYRAAFAALVAACCGGGGGGGPPSSTAIAVAGAPGTDGVFDPAPMSDGAGALWMSYSTVRPSPHATTDAPLNQVRTRLAFSPDRGATWSDAGVDPNHFVDPDLQVPGPVWATWRFEVSRVLYDPWDVDTSRRWKLLWHRLIAVAGGTEGVPHFEAGWIGLTTASTPGGTWSAERKLFTGTGYDAPGMNAFLGAPELPLASLHPGAAELGGCAAFSEPGLLARSDGIYVSLLCAGATAGKIVLLRCDRAFSSCDYLGDLLRDGDAPALSRAGEALQGFSATELVETGRAVYLIVTPWVNPPQSYRGCLAFRVSDLADATVERRDGVPVVAARISGTAGSFHGACGYDPGATASGVLYSQREAAAPHYRLRASHLRLP